jgi:hypothetical protein
MWELLLFAVPIREYNGQLGRLWKNPTCQNGQQQDSVVSNMPHCRLN